MPAQSDFNFAQYVFDVNRGWPDHLAYIDDQESVTYQDLEQHSRGIAKGLQQRYFDRRLRVMISASDSIDLPMVLLACMLGGHIVIMCNANGTDSIVSNYIKVSRPDIIYSDDSAQERLRYLTQKLNHVCIEICSITTTRSMWQLHDMLSCSTTTTTKKSAALCLFTSGGGGGAKAVVHTHGSMLAAGLSTSQISDVAIHDVIYVTSKLSFSYGLSYAFYSNLVTGSTAVLKKGMPVPRVVVQTIKQHRPGVLASIPKIYNSILKSDLDISQLPMKLCVSAGEPLPASIDLEWTSATGTGIYDMYGLSEITAMALCNRPGDKKIGSAGKPTPGTECHLKDDQGNHCADGELGQLYVKSPSQAIGYHNDPVSSAHAFRGDWTVTGDLFIREPDGFFKFIGRVNDVFKVDAKWVSPIEIENILLQNEFVQEVGVTNKKNQDGLAEVVAVIVPKSNTSLPENFQHQLKRLLRTQLEPHKVPTTMLLSTRLPRNANGKLMRHLL